MSNQEKQAREAVAMDMGGTYINHARCHWPKAKSVGDFLHLVQAFARVIDKVRRLEYRKANKSGRKGVKGSRYVLLKNEDNLTDRQRNHLRSILALNETLSTMYVLKDQLKLLYFYSDRRRVRQALETWSQMAETIRYPEVKAFVKRLRRHAYGIVNHADYPIGTSPLEGMNNKIKGSKRKAYGFHDIEYFVLKVKQAFAA